MPHKGTKTAKPAPLKVPSKMTRAGKSQKKATWK